MEFYEIPAAISFGFKLTILLVVFSEKWEKKNLVWHQNGTVSFNQEKIYTFQESESSGSEDDVVVVPNIPMLVSKPSKNRRFHFFYVITSGVMRRGTR